MANTSAQQTNGANTLIVPSLIPFSSASQLSSVNSPGLASTQSLIAQNQLAQQQQFLQVIPQEFQVPQLYQHTMFPHVIQPQTSLTLQQQNSIQITNEQLAAAKKKQNKQQKIVSKASNQLQQQILKSNVSNQFNTQNNQPMVISQPMSNVISNSQQAIAANKKIMDSQKNKIQLIQNSQLAQQAFVNSQFKPHLPGLAQQSPVLNQTQLITTPIQQIPQQQIAWAQTNPIQSIQSQPRIIFGPTTHATTDVFIPNANSGLQQLYLSSNNQNVMQLVTHHPANVQHQQQPIIHTTSHTTTPTNVQSSNKLKPIKPASSLTNLSMSTQSNGYSLSKAVKPIMSGEKKSSKKEQEKLNSKFSTKSTQQMNAELLALNEKNKLQRSESMKSLDSSKSKSENKQLKKQSSQDDDSSNSMSNSSSNGSCKKPEKKIKQKAIVKPQIMTHCVDGYIIHESSFPFPINVTEELNEELEQIKLNNNNNNNTNAAVITVSNEKVKSKKPKKFKLKSNQAQSSPSIKNQSTTIQQLNSTITPIVNNESSNNNLIEMQKKITVEPVKIEEQSQQSTIVKERKSNVVSVAPISETSNSLDESNVYRWSVDQVYDYLIKQDVSESIVKELRKAQIDGRSLTLLSIPILKDKFMFKLGPILSLKKKIDELKEKAHDQFDDYVPASGENIYNWSVKDTYQFILHLSSKEHAEEFERQEMDGHSLTLISTDNIVNDMNIPLGHALKIFHRIEELKKKSSK